MLVKDFREIELRQDKGQLYENFVFLALLKNLPSYAEIYFYRTKDKTEVDFIVQDMHKTITIEVRSSSFAKPVQIKALHNLNGLLKPNLSFVINQSLNYKTAEYQFIPVLLTEKIFSICQKRPGRFWKPFRSLCEILENYAFTTLLISYTSTF